MSQVFSSGGRKTTSDTLVEESNKRGKETSIAVYKSKLAAHGPVQDYGLLEQRQDLHQRLQLPKLTMLLLLINL